eukprot:TRINITY_DN11599_c0_g1_i1.p1 TRINITY_DN11599_c0_g1~~TRINITY_DN11599_c0_g1_i1.p1  ORF type:complete len:308 (-),score=48.83 TRINITY_DN11599_c0_g1_i1:304-1227(-)
MPTEYIDEDDLDEEDLKILAEIKKKGYYHGRPKSVACPPPVKIEPSTVEPTAAPIAGRAAFDDFQRKWDCFDRDDYLEKIGSSKELPTASAPQPPPRAPPKDPTVAAEFMIVLVGPRGAGKSSFLRRFLTGEFDLQLSEPTREVEIHALRFVTNCGDIVFNVWDLPGEIDVECSQAEGAIVFTTPFDMESTDHGIRYVNSACGSIPIVIARNKVDHAELKVDADIARKYRKQGVQFYDISVLSRVHLQKPFLWLARQLANQPELEIVGPLVAAPVYPIMSEEYREWHAEVLDEALEVEVPRDHGWGW